MVDITLGALKGCYDLGLDLWNRHRKVAAISACTEGFMEDSMGIE